MAITGVHYRLLKEHANLFKRGGSLLEIGEANWYGDADPWEIDGIDGGSLGKQIHAGLLLDIQKNDLFAIAKHVYRVLFAPSKVDAIDLHGTEKALKRDLNKPLQFKDYADPLYDVVINHGTAEHIFNVAEVFNTMHKACAVGGYMIHDAPFTGWIDHGFYLVQPGLFYDLAHANEYELVSMSMTHFQTGTIKRIETREQWHTVTEIPWNAMLFVVFKKTKEAAFRVPMQGVYDGQLSDAGKLAWHERR